MKFELHITVDQPADVELWTRFCRGKDIKPVFVELSQGQFPKQLMCAVNLDCGFPEMEAYIKKLEADIADAGFKTIRTKLECLMSEMAEMFPPAIYHETHLIFTLKTDQVDTFMRLSEDLGMVWSRNLLPREDGLLKYYLTLRLSSASLAAAKVSFKDKLVKARKVLPVRSVHLESAIYDRGRYIDRGWIE